MTSKKETIVIATYHIKRNGAVIYRMRSNVPNKLGRIDGCDQVEREEKFYDVYMVTTDGEYVCGCETSGEQCRGSRYRGSCCHRKHAQKLLDAAKVVAPVVVEMPTQQVVEVAQVVAIEEVAEVKAERATTYSPDLCCRVYVDTNEPVEGQVVNGLVWDTDRGWVAPVIEIKARKRDMMGAALTQNRAFSILKLA